MKQNQYGNHPGKWDRSGIVVEALPFNQYHVIIDGSRRLTRRNRKFLRRYEAASGTIKWPAGVNGNAAPDRSWRGIQPTGGCGGGDAQYEGDNQTDNPHSATRAGDCEPEVHDIPDQDCDSVPSQADQGNPPATSHPEKREKLAVRRLRDFNQPGRREQELPRRRNPRA